MQTPQTTSTLSDYLTKSLASLSDAESTLTAFIDHEKAQNSLVAAMLEGVVSEMQYQREIIKRGISITSNL